jgi:hypothetical protein
MKSTVVPAQVTTVEDRIAGSLGMNQLLLLIAPVFFDSALYIILPPNLHFALYKIVVMAILLVLCCISAIRIKGKLVIHWVITIARYNLRPRYYLYNKNSLATREEYVSNQTVEVEVETDDQPTAYQRLEPLPIPDIVRLQAFMDNPAAKLAFETTKQGGLYARITEVKDQG